MESAFPILARIVRTDEVVVYRTPQEIPTGVAFKVLKTQYKEKDDGDRNQG